MKKLAIISLIYLEDDWKETFEILKKVELDYDVFYADRDGVGNMSRAFNDAYKKYYGFNYEYVWFITNITFDPGIIGKLLTAMDMNQMLGGIHPVMNSSDHLHLRRYSPGAEVVRIVPFIELTAPMFRTSTFQTFMLCEETPYYYMDLIISHDIKSTGKYVAVHNYAEVNHTYLRNKKSDHPISQIRKQLRDYHTPLSKKFMVEQYGQDWQQLLCWKP